MERLPPGLGLDRNFGDRDGRNRRDHDLADVDAPPARYGDTFSRVSIRHPHPCSIATVSGKEGLQ